MKNSKTILSLAFVLITVFGHAQRLKVEQVKANEFHIQVADPKSKVSWNALPDNWKAAQVLPLKSNDEIVVLASVHPIVKSVTNKRPEYEAPRGIQLQGAVNFRDLGGYKTKEGKQVRWGKIYRSADISKLTDLDLKALAQLHIRMICDLRGEREAEAAPDKVISGADRMLLSAGSENVGAPGSFMKYMTTPQRADSMIRGFYARTDHLKAKYKPLFDQLLTLETDNALLFHCTAGKDRTGVGAALILYALGVDEATILEDYEATNEYRKESNELFIKAIIAQGLPENAARSMMAANPEYLKTAMDSINKQYGSLDNFLESEIGLSPTEKRKLRRKFLY
jgi:protein-tyrosine phosphatase